MPLEERRARHKALLAVVSDYDVDRWQREFLGALRGDNGNAHELHNTPALAPWPSLAPSPERRDLAPADYPTTY
jgi:trehalose 6-phosphate synthase